ncbi:DEHA2B10054p [Debaryomyces hansenii CBS767]|uniref:DEHA2B10054p n=1 Tax=Debaryomyces hansenii (strain ATCC 36239 / CBS 767 / BCRC 21394 / JCM 1990 / NBRC 0083 / IGC 2968) TaxID=284592 RepID=Q6BWN0_DEBHA|nr:DEHA2B10054p [Debaryomyces hansenii CBS767]CAG85393.2 DEHA2B10054p [Debaryomyces hansenii CBS767]|eukprot:XP_457389.2 DEHA2B10054p [Debaryomyces hansenii CBS767]
MIYIVEEMKNFKVDESLVEYENDEYVLVQCVRTYSSSPLINNLGNCKNSIYF